MCCDGLGLINGYQQNYQKSLSYFKRCYEIAEKFDDSYYMASTCYNLACLYAETNKAPMCLKFLKQSISLDNKTREKAARDPSFENLKNNPQFRKLINNQS